MRFNKLGKGPDDLPRGVIVVSVDITSAEGNPGDYRYKAENPRRLRRT